MNLQVMHQVQPYVIEKIKQSLKQLQENNKGKLQGYKNELIKYLGELSLIQETMEQWTNKDKYYNTITGISDMTEIQQYKAQKQNGQTRLWYEKIVRNLFLLEHRIMDELSSLETQTAEYAFYYLDDAAVAEHEIIRGVIPAETLYGEKASNLKVTKRGIEVTEQTVKNIINQGKFDKVERFKLNDDKEIYSQIVKQLQQNLTERLDQLKVAEKQKQLSKAERKELNKLRWLLSSGEKHKVREGYFTKLKLGDMEGLFNVNLNKVFTNRGHIVETLERWIQSGESKDADLNKLLQQSYGNDPWWSKGDVNKTQVKGFFDNSDSDSRQIAGLGSLIQLAQDLIYLISQIENLGNDAELDSRLNDLFNKKAKQVDKDIGNSVEKSISKQIQNAFQH